MICSTVRSAPLVRLLLLVLTFVPTAGAQRAVSQEAVDAAIARGVEYLVGREKEGSWSEFIKGAAGKNALALYTLLKAGVPKDDPVILRGVRRLIDEEARGTYDAAAMIMALEAAGGYAHRTRIEELAALLVSWQTEGDWGYPAGSDLSNTQYAVLGLWSASRARVEIPERVWLEMMPALLGYQNEDGGFRYKGAVGPSTGAMTAAALTVFGLSDALAPSKRPWNGTVKRELAAARESGLAWLEKAFEIKHNPGTHEWHLYYLYSLERLGAILGIKHFQDRSWYDEGARWLLKHQAEDGAWELGLAPTCFSLLFLCRATQSRSGPDAKKTARAGIEDPESPMQVIAKGDTPLSMWITGWNEEVLKDYVWPGEEGKGPRVAKIEYVVDGEVIASVSSSSASPVESERFAAQHRFSLPGTYGIRLRAHLMPFRESDSGAMVPGELRVVETRDFFVSVFGAWPDWFKAQAGDAMRNRMPAKRWVKSEASSEYQGGGDLPYQTFGAKLTLDRRSGTAWIAAANDESPKLVIEFDSPVEMDRILLSHARLSHVPDEAIGQAEFAYVRVNGEKRPKKVKLFPERRRKATFNLGRPTEVRTIEIMLERGFTGEGRVLGLSEVEVQLIGRSRRK
ncbi:MAG: hypothetical protein ACI8QC_002628 [Planctomycetota bacterium]|jgi:hypothetical protein